MPRRGRVENLKPFQPGQSGNPGGRAKGLRQYLRELYGEDAKPLIDQLTDLREHCKDPRIRLEAAKLLLAYHSGQPQAQLELSGQTVGASIVQMVLQPSSGVQGSMPRSAEALALPEPEAST